MTITQTTTTIQNLSRPNEFSWWLSVWLPFFISIAAGFVTNGLAVFITGKLTWKKAEEKMSATPEDILVYIEGLKNKNETNTADKQTLLDCYHGYKKQAERAARGEQSEGVQGMKTLLPHERRLIVTLYNAIQSRSFMGRRFVLRPLDEAKSQAWNNIEYRDFVCAVVSEESGISPTP